MEEFRDKLDFTEEPNNNPELEEFLEEVAEHVLLEAAEEETHLIKPEILPNIS